MTQTQSNIINIIIVTIYNIIIILMFVFILIHGGLESGFIIY